MGSPATRDEFVVNLFFDGGQDTRFLKASFALPALDTVLGLRLQRAWAERENRELKRCSDEKARLQEFLNQRGLAHTADHVGVD